MALSEIEKVIAKRGTQSFVTFERNFSICKRNRLNLLTEVVTIKRAIINAEENFFTQQTGNRISIPLSLH